ncbi:MAG: RNA pseudouridine synthase [Verrucomicrobia bacterium]|nr:RNA pseudouridine synthase [Verrucomicrobiota bacterium]
MKLLDKESIVFLDNHLLAVDKPAMVETQGELLTAAKQWIKDRFKKPGAVFLEPIHRLDKPACGIVLFARTSKALSRLQEEMRERRIKKTYHAIIEGTLPAKEGTLRHHLTHGEFRAHVDAKGKEAILHYSVIEKKGNKTLIEISLETGRYHQIRAQLGAIKCPILGDKKYGSHTDYSSGIALRHVCMELEHPVTKQPLSLKIKGFSL